VADNSDINATVLACDLVRFGNNPGDIQFMKIDFKARHLNATMASLSYWSIEMVASIILEPDYLNQITKHKKTSSNRNTRKSIVGSRCGALRSLQQAQERGKKDQKCNHRKFPWKVKDTVETGSKRRQFDQSSWRKQVKMVFRG